MIFIRPGNDVAHHTKAVDEVSAELSRDYGRPRVAGEYRQSIAHCQVGIRIGRSVLGKLGLSQDCEDCGERMDTALSPHPFNRSPTFSGPSHVASVDEAAHQHVTDAGPSHLACEHGSRGRSYSFCSPTATTPSQRKLRPFRTIQAATLPLPHSSDKRFPLRASLRPTSTFAVRWQLSRNRTTTTAPLRQPRSETCQACRSPRRSADVDLLPASRGRSDSRTLMNRRALP